MLSEAGGAARKLAQEDLPALNKMMNDAGMPHITIPGGGRARAAQAEEEEEDADPDPF